MASCHPHAALCQSSHRIHRIHRSFWRRNILLRISQMLTDFYVALVAPNLCTSVQSVGVFVGGYGILPYLRHPLKSSHRIHRIHRSFWCRIFSHGFHRFPQMVRLRYWRRGYGRMPYPPNLCASVLSVGGTSLPECSVCSAYSVENSLPVCFVGSVVVFSPRNSRNSRNVRLRYWRRGYGRDAIPS